MANRKPYVHEFKTEEGHSVGTVDNDGNTTLAGALTVTGAATFSGVVTDSKATTQSISAAGAIDVDAEYVAIAGGTGYAVTLAAPSRNGVVKVIKLVSITSGAVTLDISTTVYGGSASSSASFDAANETLVVVSAGAKWLVLKEQGVTLS